MPRCPTCHADNPPEAPLCLRCAGLLAEPPPEITQVVRSRPVAKAAAAPTAEHDANLPSTQPLDAVPIVPEGLTADQLFAAAAALDPAPRPEPAADAPRLRVLRGRRLNVEYPLYDGPNLIGRRDDRPVDIDLEDQEPVERIWSSRRHAVITRESGAMSIEDLNSLNGTFVNRHRVYPGQKRALAANDVVQIGTIQLKVTV